MQPTKKVDWSKKKAGTKAEIKLLVFLFANGSGKTVLEDNLQTQKLNSNLY